MGDQDAGGGADAVHAAALERAWQMMQGAHAFETVERIRAHALAEGLDDLARDVAAARDEAAQAHDPRVLAEAVRAHAGYAARKLWHARRGVAATEDELRAASLPDHQRFRSLALPVGVKSWNEPLWSKRFAAIADVFVRVEWFAIAGEDL